MEATFLFNPHNCGHMKSIPEISVYSFSKSTGFSCIFQMVYGRDSQYICYVKANLFSF